MTETQTTPSPAEEKDAKRKARAEAARQLAAIQASGIYKAVEKAGGVSPMAKAMGVSRQVAYVWVRAGGAPLRRAIQLEKLYGISRLQLLDPTFKARLIGTEDTAAPPRKA